MGALLAFLTEMLLASRGIRDLAASATEDRDAAEPLREEGDQSATEPSGGSRSKTDPRTHRFAGIGPDSLLGSAILRGIVRCGTIMRSASAAERLPRHPEPERQHGAHPGVEIPIDAGGLVSLGHRIRRDDQKRVAVFGPERYPVVTGRIAMPSLIAQAAAPSIGAILLAASAWMGR
jgi:hypothetical protein